MGPTDGQVVVLVLMVVVLQLAVEMLLLLAVEDEDIAGTILRMVKLPVKPAAQEHNYPHATQVQKIYVILCHIWFLRKECLRNKLYTSLSVSKLLNLSLGQIHNGTYSLSCSIQGS